MLTSFPPRLPTLQSNQHDEANGVLFGIVARIKRLRSSTERLDEATQQGEKALNTFHAWSVAIQKKLTTWRCCGSGRCVRCSDCAHAAVAAHANAGQHRDMQRATATVRFGDRRDERLAAIAEARIQWYGS